MEDCTTRLGFVVKVYVMVCPYQAAQKQLCKPVLFPGSSPAFQCLILRLFPASQLQIKATSESFIFVVELQIKLFDIE